MTIRSFTIRNGRMTSSQKQALQNYSAQHVITGTQIDALCHAKSKLVLEIGYGMGDNLIHLAREYPDYQFLGIEVHKAGVGKVLDNIVNLELTNIKLVIADAQQILEQHISDAACGHIFVLFPDPWQKKRHHKRRLLSVPFLHLLARKLNLGGILTIATDWQNYANSIQANLSQQSLLRQLDTTIDHNKVNILPRSQTKFEMRGIKRGHTITQFQLIKEEIKPPIFETTKKVKRYPIN